MKVDDLTKVDDLMSTRPVCIGGAASAEEADARARSEGVHYLLVVDADNSLRGITCLCDVARARLDEPVSGFAQTSPTFVLAGEPASRAADIMRDCAVGCLPVLRDPGEVVGVLTRHDLRGAGLLESGSSPVKCASCGSHHGLVETGGGVAFCRSCLENTPPPGTLARRWYCTLGDGD